MLNLDIGEQFGGILDLVDQHRRRKALHEQGRVAFGKGEHQRVVQGDVGPFAVVWRRKVVLPTWRVPVTSNAGNCREASLNQVSRVRVRYMEGRYRLNCIAIAIWTTGGYCVNGFSGIGNVWWNH